MELRVIEVEGLVMTQQDENPYESPTAEQMGGEQGASARSVFPYAVGWVVLSNFGLCVLAPGVGIIMGGLVSGPGLFNGYASLKRKLRYEDVDSAEQWYCILMGFAQLLPLGILAGVAMMMVGSLVVAWIDNSSTHDMAIDEAIGGFFSGAITALIIYFGGLIAMIRWKACN